MNKTSSWVDGVLSHRQPLEPIATDVIPELHKLSSVRAVVFDVYGTLVISGSGDVGSADSVSHQSKIVDAMDAVGWSTSAGTMPTAEVLHEQIRTLNDARRGPECPKPEVDIVEAWRRTLDQCGVAFPAEGSKRLVELATMYEAFANPTWPMPGAARLLQRLRLGGIPMGIVSNAQIFTLPLVEDLLSRSEGADRPADEATDLADGGFDLDLCIFSNRFRQAKPGPRLFDVLREGLARRGISPHQAVYVGNDMLNDMWAASQAGLRTAWFAGDARSCRPRSDDRRCQSLRPDVVLTNLMQLLECLEIQ